METSELSSVLVGEVLEPGDGDYDEARALWNMRFDRRPDAIARCANGEDVAVAIEFARRHGVALSIKAGGHSYAARSVGDRGLLIDLSQMSALDVDADDRVVRLEPGVTCGMLDAATQEVGLATPTPTVSSVSVIGAALGGGGGYLSRKHGLTADNVRAADVVTADGRRLRASEDENPDLFWALRGGGGNFGVVTSIELSLYEVGPQVLAGQIIYPFDRAGEHLRFFRDFMAQAPREFQCYPFTFRVPPIDLFPEETHGQPVLDFVLYHEDPGAAQFVEPLRALDDPILEFVAPTPYVDAQKAFDANLPKGQRYLSKAHDLAELSDGAIDTMVDFVPRMVGEFSAAYFDPQGGAIENVPQSATPYAGRDARYGFHVVAGWMDQGQDAAVMRWASDFHAAMAPHATGGVYVNLIGDDELDRVPAAYGGNYDRLVDLKGRWDPENLFASNYNIEP